MNKLLTAMGVLGVAALLAGPAAPAAAGERHAGGYRSGDRIEVSSHRRYVVRRYWGPRYYGYYYDDPYHAYAYYRYRRYHRPGPYFYVGPGGFGFGVW